MFMSLEIRPCTLKFANTYVAQKHRHNQPTTGHKYSLACYDGNRLCGVAIVGRPVARKMDDGMTAECLRICTDGTFNACTKLYGACARVAKDMGYRKIITYTLQSEPGTSLKASGWVNVGEAGGGNWSVPSRPRELIQESLFGTVQKYPTERKQRWEKVFK